MSAQRPGHKVWGEPEVLSCYSSSGTGGASVEHSKNGGGSKEPSKERRFPQELQQYLRSSVAKVAADDNSEGSSGPDATLPRKGGFVVPGSSSAGPAPGRCQAASESEEGEEGASSSGLGRGLASVGSALHQTRQCRPCMYVSSKTGCIKGQDCQYCHLAHPKKNRPRPCKATRLQCKQLASMLDVLSADAEQMIKATEVLGDNAAYMRTVLRGKQRQLAGEADSRAGDGEDGKDDDVLSI